MQSCACSDAAVTSSRTDCGLVNPVEPVARLGCLLAMGAWLHVSMGFLRLSHPCRSAEHQGGRDDAKRIRGLA